MKRVAFKMKLIAGCANEYKKRHDEIWPELEALLKKSGISNYSIFLDEETNVLLAVMKVSDDVAAEGLAKQEIMQRWWKYMGDITETNPDSSPVIVPLKEVFYLP